MMAINCASLCVLSNIYNIPKRCSNQENACSRVHPLLRFLSSYGSSISRLSLSRLQATNANPCNKLRNLGDFYLPRKKVDVTSSVTRSNFDTLPRRRESLPPQDRHPRRASHEFFHVLDDFPFPRNNCALEVPTRKPPVLPCFAPVSHPQRAGDLSE